VAASFDDERPWRKQARALREAQQGYEAYSPIADEETLREMRPHSTQDPVRLWTLLGGIFGGVVVAFCMVIWMSKDWPLVVGGKPITSWPPFICICFEMTVLYASFACTGAFFIRGRLPHLTLAAAYRPEFAVDRFGLFVPCTEAETAHWRRVLIASGAVRSWTVTNPERGRLEVPGAWERGDPDLGGER
jgi:hypothetical protein